MTSPPEQRADDGRPEETDIPRFRSTEDEAVFWDTHDSADFEAAFEPVTNVRFVRPRAKKHISVRLDAEAYARLTRLAAARGVGASALVRAWILDHLHDAGDPSSAAD